MANLEAVPSFQTFRSSFSFVNDMVISKVERRGVLILTNLVRSSTLKRKCFLIWLSISGCLREMKGCDSSARAWGQECESVITDVAHFHVKLFISISQVTE